MPRLKASSQQVPPRKKRTFFSANKLPALPLARAPSPPRAVSSDRVLAALQPDAHVVVAAKNFVKDKMGDDKWEIADKTRVTRGAAAAASTTLPLKRRGRPARKAPIAKVQPKVVAVGGVTGTIGQRIKATAIQTATVARKITLRTRAPTTPATSTTTSDAEEEDEVDEEDEEHTLEPPVAGPSNTSSSAAPVANAAPKEAPEPNPSKMKDYMTAGFYCQDEQPSSDRVLVNRVLAQRGEPVKRGPGRPRKSAPMPPIPTAEGEGVSFPPLPLDHGHVHFFGTEREFVLPYNIMWESETGALDGKKRPPFYTKLRSNQFIERPKCPAEDPATCNCEPTEGCSDNCINRIMSYLCGKDCPCGELCGNKSLARRKGKATKVVWTGARGFGLFAAEDISEGDFVTDYRGDVIHINTFIERIESEYKSQRNYYALAYDGNEVIDAGLRGNDARFINHGCQPNLEVRKLQTMGDGFEEFEVGMWALRDIKSGEELFYDYNFDSFSIELKKDDMRQRCLCGAPNCIGFLGRKQGEKSAKVRAAQLESDRQEEERKAAAKEDTKTKRAEKAAAAADVVPTPAPAPAPAPPAPAPVVAAAPSVGAVPVTPVKRGPGRPRKHPLSTSTVPESADGTPAGETPIKRKRGRPPKPRPEGFQLIKRPRGRPRIHPLPDPDAPLVKRPRGRPRKNALAGQTTTMSVGAATVARLSRVAGLSRAAPSSASNANAVAGPSNAAAGPSTAVPAAGPNPAMVNNFWKSSVPRTAAAEPAPAPAPAPAADAAPTTAQPTGNHWVAAKAEPTENGDAPGPSRIRLTNLFNRPVPYPIKRGPGRPRKMDTIGAAVGSAVSSVTGLVKRKPGRPRKEVPPEEANGPPLPRATPKQLQKAKRNGAPCGWAYVPVAIPAGAVPAAGPSGDADAPATAQAPAAVAPIAAASGGPGSSAGDDDGGGEGSGGSGRRSRRTSRRIEYEE